MSADTALTEKDKTQLLDYLRQSHGAKEAKQKITLTRKQTTEIKKSDGTGKSRTIQVEVRKKRVLVKRDAVEPRAGRGAEASSLDAEQAALREAEAKQQAELAARQAEEVERKAEAGAAQEGSASAEAQAAEREAPRPKPQDGRGAAEAEAPVRRGSRGRGRAPRRRRAAVEGTLHKPDDQARASEDKKSREEAGQAGRRGATKRAKRRTIKTRGDAGGGLGLARAQGRPSRAIATTAMQQHAFAAPTEPHDPRDRRSRNDHRGRSRAQDVA